MSTQDRLVIKQRPIPVIESAPNLEPEVQAQIVNEDDTQPVIVTEREEKAFAIGLAIGNEMNLTQSEVQSLRSRMKVILNDNNKQIAQLTKLQKLFYEKADKMQAELPHVQKAFECLNETREMLRDAKAQLRRDEKIQRKLRFAQSFL